MKKTILASSLAIILNMAFFQMPAYGDVYKGFAAYKNKDYSTALKEFQEDAEKGNAYAQYNLGMQYEKGEGVKQDTQEAIKWFRLSAEQGITNAQNNLAVMYTIGKGVTKNHVLAYALYSIAAVNNNNAIAKKNRDDLGPKLTPEQLEEAESISKTWKVNTPFPTTTKN